MAMEEPDTRVVSLESKNKISIRSNKNSIASHWDSGKGDIVGIVAFIVGRTSDDLEVMSVQMERMLSGIKIVEHNVDDLILFKDKGVRIHSVNSRLGRVCAGGEGCKEGGYFWMHVGYSIEESTVIGKLFDAFQTNVKRTSSLRLQDCP